MVVMVTGGAGFIGSEVVRQLVSAGREVVVVDCLTYAGSLANLAEVADSPLFAFEEVDIRDTAALDGVFGRHDIASVIHLAAESHVDRSIENGLVFIQTNVMGTANLLEVARSHWADTLRDEGAHRFTHVSTDEVYGDLDPGAAPATEDLPYRPSSPYSASKAASDHMVTAWGRTYGLPYVITNCSNNYGPYQYPEKLIPVTIKKCLEGKPIPVYGDGRQVRDWIHVSDHARGVIMAHDLGRNGERYLLGARNELSNLDLVHMMCDEVERQTGSINLRDLITFVTDRAGHDRRYAIDPQKSELELGWAPRKSFDDGLAETVAWFRERQDKGDAR